MTSAVISYSQILGHSLLRDLQNLLMGSSTNKSTAFVALGHLFTNHIMSAMRIFHFPFKLFLFFPSFSLSFSFGGGKSLEKLTYRVDNFLFPWYTELFCYLDVVCHI